jgi:hypothetical protein
MNDACASTCMDHQFVATFKSIDIAASLYLVNAK